MTGFGDSGMHDEWDPAAWLSVPGVDYLTAWREAKTQADALNTVFAAAGWSPADVRAVAVSEADGSASVSIRTTIEAARKMARLLSQARGFGHAA